MMSAIASLPVSEIVFWVLAGAMTALTVSLLVGTLSPAGHSLLAKRAGQMITCVVPLAALGLYMTLGRADLTAWRTRAVLPPFIASAVEKLQADTVEHPDDKEAWILLGDVYRKINRYSQAADAYRHALALVPDNATLKASLGEMLVMEAGGRVDAPALVLFQQAPEQPSARYYLALAQSQSGDWQGALDAWNRLAADSPTDAPWQMATRARIADAQRALGNNP